MKNDKKILPPFLMVRSGLLNDYLFALIIGALSFVPWLVNGAIAHKSVVIPTAISIGAMIIASVRIDRKKSSMQDEIESLQAHINGFKAGMDDFSLFLTDFPKMTERVIQYASKHDGAMFNMIMKQPNFVQNPKIATDIIVGHLEENPDDAKLMDKNQVNIQAIPPRLYKKIIQINPKLKVR